MRELFIDCSLGAAGDMISAALLELCPDKAAVLDRLNSFGIPGVVYTAGTVQRYSISGTHLTVSCSGHEEDGEDEHEHEYHHHHRSVADIHGIIDALNLPENVKNDVKGVYAIIAGAEAKVHDCAPGDIHFHELGTMDAIADISAACYIINGLNVDHITASPMRTGYGTVKCAHGIMPVPAPATALILEGMPSFAGDIEGEMCTPTGAALIKYFAAGYGNAPEMTVTAIGCGMGKKDFGRFTALRACLGDSENSAVELSCNVDDMSPEAIGFAIDELRCAGALDVFYTQIAMKKNRPGVLLTVICTPSQRDKMVRLIFRHTTTIGIREALCRRYILRRHEEIKQTPYGAVRIKLSEGFGVQRRKAEYDDLARIARDKNMTLEQVQKLI